MALARNQVESRRVNWSAVFSGALATCGVGISLVFLGNAVGLSVINVLDPMVPSAIQISSWAFALVAVWISALFGGFVCARVAAGSESLNALISWTLVGVGMTLFVLHESFTFRLLIEGEGPMAAHWLIIAGALGGAVCASLGGFKVRRSRMRRAASEQPSLQRAA